MLLVRTTLLLACALSLLAQTDPAQPDSAQDNSGSEYSGPAILSRGENPVPQNAAPVAFRPYIGFSGVYDTGLLAVGVNSKGEIPTTDLYGEELNLGAYTYRNWKRTTLSLDYRGNFRHYSSSYWDGTDQLLSLALSHRSSKRTTFTLREQAGTYSRYYALGAPLGELDPSYLQTPQNDIFDNRVIFLSTSGDLTYRASGRLSFNFGGDGNLVRRRSSALYGLTGAIARADMEYRVTRHSTIGVDYRYMRYDYTRGYGNSNIHSVGLNYSTQFSPHLQFSARVGGARVETLSLAEITLDPAVAALLGESVAIQSAHRLNYIPDIQARLTDTFRQSRFSLAYYNTVDPGNGVYLTSHSNQGTASYSYTGVRYWNFGADASYGRMNALLQTIGAYTTYGAGVGITRELGKGFHAVGRMDARHYDIAVTSAFSHNEYRATLGLTFSPGDLPLALW